MKTTSFIAMASLVVGLGPDLARPHRSTTGFQLGRTDRRKPSFKNFEISYLIHFKI